jgi:multidrug transporter EmrE-like cation transporter
MWDKLLFSGLYLAVSLFGLYQIKAATPGLNAGYLLGVLAYAAGFLLWLQMIRLFPLSTAFPLAAGALICGTQLVGILALGEQYDAAKVAGVLLILAGIGALAVSELRAAHG